MSLTWPYVAGLFDGEGYVGVQVGGKAVSAKISIVQAGEQGKRIIPVLQEWLKQQGIKSYVHYRKRSLEKSKWQDLWTLESHSRVTVIPFLKAIRPYVIIKKPAVEDVLRFFTVFPKLSCATRTDGAVKWKKRVALYGPSGNKCGLYSRQIKKESVCPSSVS